MKKYLIKRMLLLVITLWGISVITFIVIHLSPGDPVSLNNGGMMSNKISFKAIEQIREMYGLDKPVMTQYMSWIKRIVTLDFGNSFSDGRSVMIKIKERLPITILLNILSMILIYLIAVPIGVYSTKYHNSKKEKVLTFILFLLYSLPVFWVGLILILFFGVKLNILPIYGITSDNFEAFTIYAKILDVLRHIILPVITMVYGGLAFLSRFIKNNMLEIMQEDFITLAKAKGLTENSILWKHAFRNSLIPLITILATTLPALIGGSVIIESIFSLPGIGLLYYNSILSRDYPVIMALSFITAVLTLFGLLLADLLYVIADPRINFEKNEI